jgi:hypothetical protein
MKLLPNVKLRAAMTPQSCAYNALIEILDRASHRGHALVAKRDPYKLWHSPISPTRYKA